MFVLSNIVLAIARVLEIVLWVYFWIIIARALVSWVNPDPYNPIVRFLSSNGWSSSPCETSRSA
ncbi:MAG: hypothetical protein DMD97_23345 [Candidatus Rokuibacteriota bacterium]|nr:MAG: hypothetical protein DMD97_23345 [Candidatus Rokubacteria bacterium]